MSANAVQPQKSSIGGLDANVMALIAYVASTVLAWIPGIRYVAWLAPLVIFFLEKDSLFVRFHAMQSFVLNAIGTIFYFLISVILGGIALASITSMSGAYAALVIMGLVTAVTFIISIVFTVFAIIALIQAYKYKEYRIPLVAGITDKLIAMFRGAAAK
mgnify:CR=1 FL=1